MKSVAAALTVALSICSFAVLTGCAAETDAPDEEGAAAATEDELKSSECPAAVDVTLEAPTVMSDATLEKSWAKDMASYESDPKAAAHDQLTLLSTHIATARAQKTVKLHGTVGKACFYATVDAQTGKPNGYHFWFAKTGYGKNVKLQLRIERDLGEPEALFFTSTVKSITPTSIKMDTSEDGRAFAQHHDTGYHGEPDGPSAWIGYANATAKVSK